MNASTPPRVCPVFTCHPRIVASLAALLALLSCATLHAAPPSVVLNEVMYHPADDRPDGEFLEIWNHGSEAVDLGGWLLTGGVTFQFPSGVRIEPAAYLVVAENRDELISRYSLDPDIVLGNFQGNLDNGSDQIQLYTPMSYLASFVDYDDSGAWPEVADGLGSSLERLSHLREETDPRAWDASIVAGGTPGARNTVFTSDSGAPSGEFVQWIDRGADWRYFRGTQAPPQDWNTRGFDDSSWDLGPAGFGYDDGDDATEINDMRNNFLTLFIRREFEVVDPSDLASLTLAIDYDDAFIAYLNGTEVARSNIGGSGFDANANDSHEAGNVESFSLTGDIGLLVAGSNVLAISGHNVDLDSSDFSLSPSLDGTLEGDEPPPPDEALVRPPRDLVINEISATGQGTGWVELYNPTDSAVDASGRRLTLFPASRGRFTIPAATSVAPGGFVVFTESQLGFELDTIAALLLTTSEDHLVDAFNPRTTSAGSSSGRFPDGRNDRNVFTSPTRGARNQLPASPRVVINEIHYNPSFENDAGEWIELYNPTALRIDVSGWQFTRGISYTFADGTTIAAGGRLVLAADPTGVEARYGIGGVVGPFVGGLSNSAETILLRDGRGNTVDRVRIADEGSWPESADGEGPSVELVHPNLDNRYGTAWRASDSEGGTPGAANSRAESDPQPALAGVRHEPVIPTSSEAVHVEVSATDDQALAEVTLFWEIDGSGGAQSVALLDDGSADDGIASNGIWGGTIPPQSDRSIVAFWIRGRSAGGQEVTIPAGSPQRAFLYQVEDSVPNLARPIYRMILRDETLREFRSRNNNSDVLLDVTFVADGKAHYNRGIRLRGQSARSCNPLSYRLQLDHDTSFHGLKRLNLNGCNSWRQWIGYDFFRRVGMESPETWFRRLSFNGDVESQWHLRVEPIKSPFLERVFPGDADGNLYRGVSNADLDYRGEDFGNYRGSYRKETNEELGDWSDVVDLSFRFDSQTTSDADFPAAIEERVDTLQWSFFFAAWAMLGTTENAILLNNGDDYYLYHRFSDDRWVLLPWDTDSVFDDATQVLFRPTVNQIERFLEHPRYAPDYLCFIQSFLETGFDSDTVNSRIDHLVPLYSEEQIRELRDFVIARRAYLEERIENTFGVTDLVGGTVCGDILYPSRADVTLVGTAPGCGTADVLVNGMPVDWDPGALRWEASMTLGGIETITLATRDRFGVVTRTVTVRVDDIDMTDVDDSVYEQAVGSNSIAAKATAYHEIRDPNGDGNVWTVRENVNGALGDGSVLKAPEDGPFGENGQSQAIYRLRFRQAGNYRVYLRARGFNRFSNSVWAPTTFNNTPTENLGVGRNGNFNWTDGSLLNVRQQAVDAGSILEVRWGVREFAAEIDGFVLSLDQNLSNGELDALVSAARGGSRPPRARFEVSPSMQVPLVGGSAEVLLDGSTSHDGSCGTDGLVWSWNVSSGPAGGWGFAGETDEVMARLFLTLAGDYEVELTVTNAATGEEAVRTETVTARTGEGTPFLLCDANGDGENSISDAVFLLLGLFAGGEQPSCRASTDCNSDGATSLSDAVYNLSHLFSGGPPPRPPYPSCDLAAPEDCESTVCLQ